MVITESFFQSLTDSSSARIFSENPSDKKASRREFLSILSHFSRLERSFFLRSANPIFTSERIHFVSVTSISFFTIKRRTADSTFGGGTKLPALTRQISSTLSHARSTNRERTDCLFPAVFRILSPTSLWRRMIISSGRFSTS